MPDLDLSGSEIEALIAYLNADADPAPEPRASGWCAELLSARAH